MSFDLDTYLTDRRALIELQQRSLAAETADLRVQFLAERTRATGKSAAEIESAMLASVPAGRFAKASEIAAVIAFLASPANALTTGTLVPVYGRA